MRNRSSIAVFSSAASLAHPVECSAAEILRNMASKRKPGGTPDGGRGRARRLKPLYEIGCELQWAMTAVAGSGAGSGTWVEAEVVSLQRGGSGWEVRITCKDGTSPPRWIREDSATLRPMPVEAASLAGRAQQRRAPSEKLSASPLWSYSLGQDLERLNQDLADARAKARLAEHRLRNEAVEEALARPCCVRLRGLIREIEEEGQVNCSTCSPRTRRSLTSRQPLAATQAGGVGGGFRGGGVRRDGGVRRGGGVRGGGD